MYLVSRIVKTNRNHPNTLSLTPSAPARLSVCKFSLHYPQIKLFGNENKANDQPQQLIKDEKQNSPNPFTRRKSAIRHTTS